MFLVHTTTKSFFLSQFMSALNLLWHDLPFVYPVGMLLDFKRKKFPTIPHCVEYRVKIQAIHSRDDKPNCKDIHP